MTDEHAILQEMDQAMNELADLAGSSNLTPDQAVQMNQKILSILLPEQTVTGAPVNTEGTDRNRWTDNGRRADCDWRTDNGRRTDFDRWTDNGRRTDCDRRTDNGGRTDFD